MEVDFGTSPSNSPEAEAEAEAELPKQPKTSEPVKYSPVFKLGLYLSVRLCFSWMLLLLTRLLTSQQMTHLVNRAIDGVKIKTRKPRSQAP